jgi:PAS domain-containing protein
LVYVLDLNHRFIYANDALLRMWGKTWDEAIGKNRFELGYDPWHLAKHAYEMDQVIATKKPIRGEVPFTGTNGRRIYDYIFVPVPAVLTERWRQLRERLATSPRESLPKKTLRESEQRFFPTRGDDPTARGDGKSGRLQISVQPSMVRVRRRDQGADGRMGLAFGLRSP